MEFKIGDTVRLKDIQSVNLQYRGQVCVVLSEPRPAVFSSSDYLVVDLMLVENKQKITQFVFKIECKIDDYKPISHMPTWF